MLAAAKAKAEAAAAAIKAKAGEVDAAYDVRYLSSAQVQARPVASPFAANASHCARFVSSSPFLAAGVRQGQRCWR
jgi:hypothetical protein